MTEEVAVVTTTVETPNTASTTIGPAVDQVVDSEKLSDVTDKLRSDWTNRRSIVLFSIYLLSTLVSILTLVASYVFLSGKAFGASNLSAFLTMYVSLLITNFSIVGAYVFGALYDSNKFMDTVAKIIPWASKKE